MFANGDRAPGHIRSEVRSADLAPKPFLESINGEEIGAFERNRGPRCSCRPAQLLEARRLLLAFTQTQPELIVEDKGLSLAVHFCQVPQQVAFSRRSKPTCIRL